MGTEIEERHNKDEEDNHANGMYFSRAKALFYNDQEMGKHLLNYIWDLDMQGVLYMI